MNHQIKKVLILILLNIIIINGLRQHCSIPNDFLTNYNDDQITVYGPTKVNGPMTTNAYQFDGVNDYIDFNQKVIGGEFSVSFYAKWETLNDWSRIVDFGNGANSNNILFGSRQSNEFNIYVHHGLNGDTTNRSNFSNQVEQGVQYNFQILFNNNGTVTVYKNGTLITPYETYIESENPVPTITRSNSYSGKSNWDNSEYFNGIIDELTFYNYHLSADQIECIQDICINKCLTCDNNPNNCDICGSNRSNPPNCMCSDGFYEDLNQICQACIYPCKTCNSNSNCLSCVSSSPARINSTNSCYCPDGYFDDGSSHQCQSCIYPCANCTSNSNCLSCVSSSPGRINSTHSCICPDRYFDDGSSHQCQQCIHPCQNCTSLNHCLTCRTSNPSRNNYLNTCFCNDGYIDDGSNAQCQKCDHQCSVCFDNISKCTQCRGDRDQLSLPNCSCGFHKFDDFSSEVCQECDEKCEVCQLSGCTECRYNKIQDTSDAHKCICGAGNIDHTDLGTDYCTNCNDAVLQVTFSRNFNDILINFYDKITIPGFQYDEFVYSTELCIYLFKQSFLEVLGIGFQCKQATTTIIQIQLDRTAQVQLGQSVGINVDVIHRDNILCSDKDFLNIFYLTNLKLHPNQQSPIITLQNVSQKVSLCEEISIPVSSIINDGQRNLQNIVWSIQSTNATDTNLIQKQLEIINLNSDLSLTIPALTLLEYSQYTFKLEYQNFANIKGVSTVIFETLSSSGTQVQILQNEPFLFFTWKLNEIIVNAQYLDCKSGTIEIIDKALDIVWEDITNSTSTQLQSVQTQPKQQQQVLELNKYMFQPDTKYEFQLKVNIPDQPFLENKQKIQLKFTKTPLTVYITGGNRLQSYSKQLELTGIAKDIDLIPENQTNGINLTWNCINMQSQTDCRTIEGDLITYNNTNYLEYPKKVFEPYNSYKFKLQGDNGEKLNLGEAIIIIVETDIPLLTVGIPEVILNQKINKNDDLEISIDYDGNSDDVFYSLIIIYKLEVVATKSFQYKKFGFKIWDLFNDFQSNQNQFLIRVSLYNPKYFMPSQSSFQAFINFEPSYGNIVITPSQGISLNTEFQIQALDFYDVDQPLTYKYSFYNSMNDYEKEKNNGGKSLELLKNSLYDYSNQNSVKSILPRADLNVNTNQFEIIIMVSVSDSLGAIKNVTQSVIVSPPINSESLEILSFTEQIQQMQTLYDNSINTQKEEKIRILNLLSMDITRIEQVDCISECSDNGTCNYNIFQCECNDGFFLLDCSLNNKQQYEDYLYLKKAIFDYLNEQSGKQISKVIEDQILKSIKMLLQANDLGQLQNSEEMDSVINNLSSAVTQQKQLIDNLISQGLINQGDTKVSRKQQHIMEIIGKSFSIMNAMFSNIDNIPKQKLNRRILTVDQEQQHKKNILDLSKQSGSVIQAAVLPNSDPISFSGNSMGSVIQKQTFQTMKNKFFPENPLGSVLDFENTDGGENLGYVYSEQVQIYNTQTVNLKQNPFKNDAGFYYSNQDGYVSDIDIFQENNTMAFSQETQEEIKVNQPVRVAFKKNKNNDGSSSSDKKQNNVCISQNKDKKWNTDSCRIIETEKDDGSIEQICECKSLSPTTVVNDLENIYDNSKTKQVFSKKGLNAFITFDYLNSYIFYMYIIQNLCMVYCISKGYMLDKQSIKIQQQEEQNKHSDEKISKIDLENIELDDKKSKKQLSVKSDTGEEDLKYQQGLKQKINNPGSLVLRDLPTTQQDNLNDKKKLSHINLDIQPIQSEQIQSPGGSLTNTNRRKRDRKFKKSFQLFNNKLDQDIENTQDNHIHSKFKFQDSHEHNFSTQPKETDRSSTNSENDENKTHNDQILKEKNELHQAQSKKSLDEDDDDNNNNFLNPNKIVKSQFSTQQKLKFQKEDSSAIQKDDKQLNVHIHNNIQDQEEYNISQTGSSRSIARSFRSDENMHQDQTPENTKKPVNIRTVEQAIFRIHKFFSIILVFKKEESRALRFTLFFTQLHLLLALTALLAKGQNQFQAILISIVSTIIMGIPITLITKLIKSQKTVLKIIGVVLTVLILLTTVYASITAASLMGVDESNQWSISFFTTFVIETFVMDPFFCLVKLTFIRSELLKGGKKIFIKLFADNQLIEFLRQQ